MFDVSIVIPAYNEKVYLEAAIPKIKEAADKFTGNYEIIIVEDNSRDGTAELAARFAREDSRIKHIHNQEKQGRGKALTAAFRQSGGKVLVYMDVDLATDLMHLSEIVGAVNSGNDIAIGSRLMKGSHTKRGFFREFAARNYIFLAKLLFRVPVSDLQCGFKAFRRESLLSMVDRVMDNHWFWDTELLILSHLSGFKIKEVPVNWKDKKGSTVNVFSDSLDMGTKLLKLWRRTRNERKL